MYFGSALHRTKSLLGRSHDNCSSKLCVANDISDTTYKTLHTTKLCHQCKLLGPDLDNITKIIEQGGFPVIQLVQLSHDNDQHFEILDGATGVPYVAISHVWSDGLGNVKQNQLFQCQLQRLQSLSDDLWASTSSSAQFQAFQDLMLPPGKTSWIHMPFWIDTICIPKKQPLRSLAISQMRAIYEKARAVLVLDSELQEQSLQLSNEELLLRISFSGWTRRMWTLQEDVLAGVLYFRMSDGVFPFLNVKILSRQSIFGSSPLLLECASLLGEITLNKELTGAKKFGWTWNHLMMRKTSHHGDSPVIFACLLGLDIKQVLEEPEDNRMISLLSQMSEYPQGILFVTGPRISKTQYRWAPSLPPTCDIYDDTPAYREKSSLMVKLPGFQFNKPLSGKDTILTFEDSDDQTCYLLSFDIHESELRPCDETWPYDDKCLGPILLARHLVASELHCAALVSINDEMAAVIYATFIRHVSVGLMSPADLEQQSPVDHQNMSRISAQKTRLDQKWSVG
jgi:Heterokaryon incompatibility protein (HET)